MSTVVYLAGFESHFNLLKKMKPRYVLFSYYYARENESEWIKFVKNNSDRIWFFVDSGAHTFQNKENLRASEMDKFLREYAKFIKRVYDHIQVYVELDVDEKFGLEKVEGWREELHSRVGEPPLVVWHPNRGAEYWKWMVKEYEYIGTQTEKKGLDMEKVGKMVSYAARNGVKVHGFGYTSIENLSRFKFYSVDSTTWINGSKFGNLCVFEKGKLRQVHYSNKDLAFRKYIEKRGYDLERLKKDYKLRDEFNVKVWMEIQKYFSGGEMNEEKEEIRTKGFGCDVCYVKDRCGWYRQGGACVVDGRVGDETFEGNEEVLRYIIEERLKRYMRARLFEDLEGGLLDKHVTQLEDGIANLIEKYLKLKYPERYGNVKVVERGASKWDELLKALGEEK